MNRKFSGDRVFLVALTVSLLFHLSMVTLFRIVIYFPRVDMEFVDVDIVEWPSEPVLAEQLTLSEPGETLERLAEDALDTERANRLPPLEFELPALPFSELDLLRVQQQGLEVRSRYRELFEEEPSDLWSQFGRELDRLSTFIAGSVETGESRDESLIPVSRPAPGFEAYLEWINEPKDRLVLAVKGIEGLRGLAPDALPEPIALIIRVNRNGRVVGVVDPIGPDDTLVEDAVDALLQYRFEPIGEDGPAIHHGTILIRGAIEGDD